MDKAYKQGVAGSSPAAPTPHAVPLAASLLSLGRARGRGHQQPVRAINDLEHRPTILYDEIDTVFGPMAKENEAVRGLPNAGHRRGAVAYRCVGEGTNQKVQAFPAYASVALAGIGDLPDTILGRSIVVAMRRRAPHERVESFRHRVHAPTGHELRDRIGA